MAGTNSSEKADILRYWEGLSKLPVTRPEWKKIQFVYELPPNPTEAQKKICGLYMIKGGTEYCFLVAQSVLDSRAGRTTSHIKAMKLFLEKMKLKEEKTFGYIAGYYLESKQKDPKTASCVNCIFSSTTTRQLGPGTQISMKTVLDKIRKEQPKLQILLDQYLG